MLSFFFLMLLRPPTSTLFPYTTLFRSRRRRLGFGFAETLLGFGLGLALGFLVLAMARSEEHTSELQSRPQLVCRLLLETKNSYRREPRLLTPEPLAAASWPSELPAALR